MNTRIYRNVAQGGVFGFALKLCLDIVFSILHRSYSPFKDFIDYLPAIALGSLIGLILYLATNAKKQTELSSDYFWLRFSLIASLVMPIRWSFTNTTPMEYFNPEASLVIINGFINYTHELIILFFLFLSVLVHFLITLYRYQQNKVKYSLAEIESYKKEQAEYRFGMLQAQIDPHFLFNSLNTLASLVHTDTEAATQFVRRLSGVYRNVLQHSKEDLHSLKEELSLLEDYCGLISIRFKDRVLFHFKVDESALSKKIAPLTLQLLIENAVKHNVIQSSNPLEITVESDEHYVMVSNPFRPKRILEESSGTGLENIKSRFKSLSTKPVIIQNDEEVFKVKIPLID